MSKLPVPPDEELMLIPRHIIEISRLQYEPRVSILSGYTPIRQTDEVSFDEFLDMVLDKTPTTPKPATRNEIQMLADAGLDLSMFDVK